MELRAVGIFTGTRDGEALVMALGDMVGSTIVIEGGLSSGIGANVSRVGAVTATGTATGLVVLVGLANGGVGTGADTGACGCRMIGGGVSNESVKAEISTTTFVVVESNGTMALFCNTDCSAS